MKVSICIGIITGVLVTSAAQADSAFSASDLEVIYSGANSSFTSDVDVSGYYTMPAGLQEELQQAAENKSTCTWRVVEGGAFAPKAAYTEEGNTEYFAPINVQLLCG